MNINKYTKLEKDVIAFLGKATDKEIKIMIRIQENSYKKGYEEGYKTGCKIKN